MPSNTDFLASIKISFQGVALAQLLAQHPNIARRTAQRQVAKLIDDGLVIAHGEGRARRHFDVKVSPKPDTHTAYKDVFPALIPVFADSQKILSYINLPLEARKPVSCQLDFLNSYQPSRQGLETGRYHLGGQKLVRQSYAACGFLIPTLQIDMPHHVERLVTNIIASFTKFEREIIGQRVKEKRAATLESGKVFHAN